MPVESLSVSPIQTTSAFDAAGHRSNPSSAGAREIAPLRLPGAKSVETTPAVPDVNDHQPLEKAIQAIDEVVKAANLSLDFSRDDETGAIVIKLIDQKTGEAVQQIPSDARLHLAAALSKLQGQLFNRQA